MSDKPWWATTLQWAIWFVVMTLVMGWLGRTRQQARPIAERGVLRHPTSTLIIGAACTGLFLAFAVLSRLFPGKDDTPVISLFFLGFASLGVPLIAEYYRVIHRLEKDGLRFTPLLSAPGFMRWADVESLRYAPSLKWFRLEGRDGRVARVSVMLMGLPEFARAALDAIPASRIDPAARVVLEQTAAGHPPPIWM